MAKRQSNTLAVITWFLGLLGCAGFINFLFPTGFFPLVVPILFWMFGNSFTKSHCRQYFNVVITGVVIYVVGIIVNYILGLFGVDIFELKYLSTIYLSIMCIFGLIAALNSKRFRPPLSVNLL